TLHLRPRPQTQSQNLRFQLYAITGARIQSGQFTDRIELGVYPAGIYLLEVTDGQTTSRHKIVRQQ
ncbi:MAG: T9SS type A sorting domain-containing protein, partial [Bacteroidota bacterium]